jgi:hypothetical protein
MKSSEGNARYTYFGHFSFGYFEGARRDALTAGSTVKERVETKLGRHETHIDNVETRVIARERRGG